jgi:transcriptional regulator with XRE-family HTH domain/mannose-6-phosphate isomerase-like protein (cupin superfamily)
MTRAVTLSRFPGQSVQCRLTLVVGDMGPRLRLAREQRGLSVRELARRIGCSASLISQIERGVSAPSVGVLYSLATELGSSLDYLVFGVPAGTGSTGHQAGDQRPRADGEDQRPATASGAAGSGAAGSGAAGSAPPCIVQRAGCRKIIDLASGVRWERLTPGAEAATDFLEVIYSPGGHSTDERRPLRHDGREYGLVLRGTLQANVGFESYELGPGDSIAFDSSTPHEYLNKTGEPVHAIWVVVHSEPGRV